MAETKIIAAKVLVTFQLLPSDEYIRRLAAMDVPIHRGALPEIRRLPNSFAVYP